MGCLDYKLILEVGTQAKHAIHTQVDRIVFLIEIGFVVTHYFDVQLYWVGHRPQKDKVTQLEKETP